CLIGVFLQHGVLRRNDSVLEEALQRMGFKDRAGTRNVESGQNYFSAFMCSMGRRQTQQCLIVVCNFFIGLGLCPHLFRSFIKECASGAQLCFCLSYTSLVRRTVAFGGSAINGSACC